MPCLVIKWLCGRVAKLRDKTSKTSKRHGVQPQQVHYLLKAQQVHCPRYGAPHKGASRRQPLGAGESKPRVSYRVASLKLAARPASRCGAAAARGAHTIRAAALGERGSAKWFAEVACCAL
eukprot:scaffold47752_cov66-Phaeocystis_antarctica.AAC.5